MPRNYPFVIEIASELGIFPTPDSGSEPCSYPVPTISAIKGILESICRIKGAVIQPIAAAVCFDVAYANYTYNSYSPIRKEQLIKDGVPSQIRCTLLEYPRFQILGLISSSGDSVPLKWGKINHAHSLQEQLKRRIRKGQFFHKPVMGWKDFPLSEFCMPKTSIKDYDTFIPSLAHIDYIDGKATPRYQINVEVKNGIIVYDNSISISVEEDENQVTYLTFANPELNNLIKKFIKKANSND